MPYPDDPGLTPEDEKPIPQPPPTIRKPDTATAPPNTQFPDPTKTEEGQHLQEQLDQAQEALRQQLEDQKRLESRAQDFDRDYQAGMKQIQQEITQADKDRATPPDLLPLNQRGEADLHAQNTLQWSWPNTLFTLGVGLLGTLGKHGHSTLSNYFLGSFFQAYAAGQQERQKEMELGWHQTNEAIFRENETRINEYKAKLSDERLSLDSKIQVMKNLADQYKDLPMLRQLQTNNLTNIRAQLSTSEKALNDYRQRQIQAWKAQKTLSKMDPETRQYQDRAKAVFISRYHYEPVTPEDWNTAMKEYSLLEFYKDKKAFGTDLKGDPKDPDVIANASPSPSGSPAPSPTPTDQDLDAAIRKYEAGQK